MNIFAQVLTSFLVSVGIACLCDTITKMFATHNLWWDNFIWWTGGATAVYLITILLK